MRAPPTGTASGIERSPARKRADRRKRKREEATWAKKCGPVVVKQTRVAAVAEHVTPKEDPDA